MKRTVITITILIVSLLSISSQTLNSMYFMDKWSQRNTYNASFAPERGYFTLPILGGIQVNLSTNVGLSNFMFPDNSGYMLFLNQNVPGESALSGLNTDNYIRQSLNMNLFSLGFYTNDNSFWSLKASLKENLNMNLPYDLFRLMKNFMVNTSNNLYDLKSLEIDQTNMAQIALSYSRDINSKIRVGATLKMNIGLTSEQISYSKFDVSLSDTRYNVTAVGQSLVMSDFLSFSKDANNYYDLSNLTAYGSKIKGSGFGLGIDLGVTYKPIDKLTLAASINDLGSISWSQSAIKQGSLNSTFQYNGFSITDINNINLQSQIDSLKNAATNLLKYKDVAVSSNIIDNIPSIMNVSAEYSVFGDKKHDITLGLLFQSYNSKLYSVNQLIAAVTLKPLSWISVSGTCEFLRKDANRIGLALNICPKGINLFIASDFISPKLNPQFIPINGTSVNLSIGGSINIGRSRN